MCTNCLEVYNADTNVNIVYENDLVDYFIFGVYTGSINIYSLPFRVYEHNYRLLKKAVETGYEGNIFEFSFGSPDYEMLKDLNESVYRFSGAKTFQQTKEASKLLAKSKSFEEFKKGATLLFDTYNKDYLQAEYQTAIGSSRMASKWIDIIRDKEVLPLLQYQTVGDSRVRPEHVALDNIIRPVGDKFWNNYYPPNGFRCRCTVIQLSEGEITDVSDFKQPESVPDEFMTNSGKTGKIFSKKHPYFKVPIEFEDQLKNNFGLPIYG